MFCWKNKRNFFSRLVIGLGVLVWLCGCDTPKEEAGFYPIDSLVSAQIQNLTTVHATLHKEVFVAEKIDTLSYIPADSGQWVKEMNIFRQLEVINKPINRGSYQIEDGLTDTTSNLTVKAFTIKNDLPSEDIKDLPVKYIRVYYQDSMNKPRKIEALYDEENTLYKSSRFLSLEFRQVNNKTILTSYFIKGGQKMILADSVAFYIRGNIVVD
jgi:hypothetical protein